MVIKNDDATPIESYLKNSLKVKVGDQISNCYLTINDYKTKYYDGDYSADYYVSVNDSEGKKLGREFKLNEIGLIDLMNIIQTNKLKRFSEVGILMLEEIAKYKKGTDIHYYLKVILDRPGAKPTISRTRKKIFACKECDIMLLRYGFRWKIQKDDLKENNCPYCAKLLIKESRLRKLIKVNLDFKEKNCSVGETRAQIGVLYHNQSIKSTINAQGIFHYLQNYQSNFENNAIGPFVISTQNGRPLKINSIKPSLMLDILEWRPVTLFPEDFFAA